MRMPERTNAAWVEALSAAAGPDPDVLADLRGQLERAAHFAIRRRLTGAHGVMSDEIDSLAEDCAQEALLLALQNLGTFRGEARFVTWASVIAVGVAMSSLRRRLWRDLSLDHMPDGWMEPASSAMASSGWEHPQLAAQRTEIWSVIKGVVARDLTDRQREVLNLVVINGVDADEVAERLGVSAGALYKLTHDARRKLKAGLLTRGFSTAEILDAFAAQR
jgi:RNA polymerase sigma-70 factor (ECF subfamily)